MDAASWIRFSQRSFRVRGRIRQRAAGFLRMRSAFQKRKRLTESTHPGEGQHGNPEPVAWKPVAGPAAVATATVESPSECYPLTNTAVAQIPWIIARPSDPTVINRCVFQKRKNEVFLVIGRCSSS